MSKVKDVYVEKDTKQVSKHFSSMRYSKTKLTDAIKNSMIFDPLGHWKLINKALQLGETNMVITLTIDLELAREKISGDFTNKHGSNWADTENPTDLELKSSIKTSVISWLDDSAITYTIAES